MLVLTRKQNEVIRIGEDVQIVVVEIIGERVRLGVIAPRSVPVHREEVYRQIQEGGRDDKRVPDGDVKANR